MNILPQIQAFHSDIAEIRRDLHRHPELLFDLHRTAEIVARTLRDYGVDEVHEGIGRIGVVGIIRGQQKAEGHVVGLRADMDALPMQEEADLPHASSISGKMHACGHDGHTAMLLAAARYLTQTRNFRGSVAVIFQPAEEGGGGGREMVEDGLIERFGITEVFGMHTFPNVPVGEFRIRSGATLASVDNIRITITGKGAHAAKPQVSIDPLIIGATVIQAVQTVVSRAVDPMEAAVVSLTTFNAGTANNVIPQSAELTGTVRTLSPAVRDLAEKRLRELLAGIASMYGAQIDLDYDRAYPVMINDAAMAKVCADVAATIVGEDNVVRDTAASLGGEDFAFMLERCPGAMIYIGQGPSAELHHPQFDFNDEIIPLGATYWARLVETR
ncbi:M20 aminoacylase family protein [Aerobium aerolatum]|uniref:Hippurate hydrolase n=1 Tax=Aquamicrobium aerolatum DSM 21857 TaxID=1121003 RepID=A0A1I3I5L2_9HYPH|nr:M20 aminoacylase family protein [Aquamicrobium aerolatum]SFI43211.1 hippurate hydrolase [Aquamicrobium aerolatum DSM 21857]